MEVFRFVVFLLSLVSIPSITCEIDPIIQKSIDDIIVYSILPVNKAPALGLAIVKDGEVIYTTGYGDRDVENQVKANSDTLFIIGSLSKSITATLVVKTLYEKFPELGESSLDIPISQLVPSYNFTLNDRYRSEATSFRDLLAHRVCSLPESSGTFFGAVPNTTHLAYIQRYAPETCPFRAGYVYDNGHYVMVGEIIAEMTGVPYLTLLENLFVQLGMNSTTYIKETDDHDNMPDRAIAYYEINGEIRRFNSELFKRFVPMVIAGGILSNANDMARYIQFHLNLGRIDDIQIIPEEAMKWFQKNVNPLPSVWKTSPDEIQYSPVGYSLGLRLSAYDGWQIMGHSGYLTPFNSHISLFPALNLGIFSSSNGPRRFLPNFSHDLLHLDILNLLQQGMQPKVLNKTFNNHQEYEHTGFSNLHSSSVSDLYLNRIQKPFQNIDIIGHYGNGLSGEFDIIEKLDSNGEMTLYMNYGVWGKGWLLPVSNGTYSITWDSDIVHDFYTLPAELFLAFDGVSELYILENEIPVEVYFRDLRVENLPVQPWSPDSCGPAMN